MQVSCSPGMKLELYDRRDEVFPCWKRMISVVAGQRPLYCSGHDQLGQRLVPSVQAVASDQHRDLPVLVEHRTTVLQHAHHAIQKYIQYRGIGKTVRIFVVSDHFPVRRMHPNEVDFAEALITTRIRRVVADPNVHAGADDLEFSANVLASSATHHRVENMFGLVVLQQIADQVAAAVAAIAIGSVRPPSRVRVDAGEMGNRARIDRRGLVVVW